MNTMITGKSFGTQVSKVKNPQDVTRLMKKALVALGVIVAILLISWLANFLGKSDL